MKLTSTGTPIPKRDIEAKARGSGPVITYRLSPEELERVRRGERLERKEESSMSTATETPKTPDKVEVLRRLAAGKPVSKIETEMGLGKGALHYWIGRWGLRGIKGEQAQQLLDEHKAETAAEAGRRVDGVAQALKDHELIERLKRELVEKEKRITELEAERERNREEIERLKATTSRTVALAGQAAEKHLAEIEQLKEERDALLQTVERAVDDGKGREVSSTEAIEAATAGLTGAHAYHTGAAIDRLWRWQTVEDLRRARHHIDRLVETVVVEGAAG